MANQGAFWQTAECQLKAPQGQRRWTHQKQETARGPNGARTPTSESGCHWFWLLRLITGQSYCNHFHIILNAGLSLLMEHYLRVVLILYLKDFKSSSTSAPYYQHPVSSSIGPPRDGEQDEELSTGLSSPLAGALMIPAGNWKGRRNLRRGSVRRSGTCSFREED